MKFTEKTKIFFRLLVSIFLPFISTQTNFVSKEQLDSNVLSQVEKCFVPEADDFTYAIVASTYSVVSIHPFEIPYEPS